MDFGQISTIIFVVNLRTKEKQPRLLRLSFNLKWKYRYKQSQFCALTSTK